jgi:hypothetical protein
MNYGYKLIADSLLTIIRTKPDATPQDIARHLRSIGGERDVTPIYTCFAQLLFELIKEQPNLTVDRLAHLFWFTFSHRD